MVLIYELKTSGVGDHTLAIKLKYKFMFNFAGVFPSAMTSPPSSFKYPCLKDFWINPRFDYPALLHVNGVGSESEIKGLPPGNTTLSFCCKCREKVCNTRLSGICFLGSDTYPQYSYLAYPEDQIGFYVVSNSVNDIDASR